MLELQSTKYLTAESNGRSIFSADLSRGSGRKHYRIFAMEKGLLFLQIKASGKENKGSGLIWAAIFGGAAGVLAASLANRGDTLYETEFRYDRYNDADLLQAARGLRGSFVCLFDEIKQASIDPPGYLSGLANRLAGFACIRDQKLGKLKLELSEPGAVASAIDVFSKHLSDRVKINVELNPNTMEYRRRR